MISRCKLPVVMTVAGSDSGGGAGIQADLKVFSALKVFGTTAITCVTAQNPNKVAGVVSLKPEMVALQMETVFSCFPVIAAKTGMLYSAEIIRTVARISQESGLKTLVVDPVMIATSGGCLMQKKAFRALCSELLPLATVMTPNIPEAEQLAGRKISSVDDMMDVALILWRRFGVACVLKGGHLIDRSGYNNGKVVDVLCAGGRLSAFRINRVPVNNTHGTGCRFSAALMSYLAMKVPLHVAVSRAQKFVARTLPDLLYQGK